MDGKTTIIIADDHQLIRDGYKSMLSERPDLAVIGEASNGMELLDLLKKNLPDIILLDIEMPVMDGIQAHGEIQKHFPQVKVIIVSMHFQESFINHFFLNGANGYIAKGGGADQLFKAIDAVMNDNYYLNASISKIILLNMLKENKNKELFGNIRLNDSQIEILKMICDERSYKEIADKMDLSIHTVDYHRRQILEKTNQSTVIGLVKYAIKNGIAQC